jgi:hypothetical protein
MSQLLQICSEAYVIEWKERESCPNGEKEMVISPNYKWPTSSQLTNRDHLPIESRLEAFMYVDSIILFVK